MAIYFYSIPENTFHVKQKLLLKKWISFITRSNEKNCGTINYIFQSDESLLALNKKYLNHNDYTDIITFNYSEGSSIHGDIHISIDRIKENAITFASSFEEELHRVMIHGILHLLGYNDKSKEEKEIMREKENDCLEIFREKSFYVK
jgi:probable rRNA maturation factor